MSLFHRHNWTLLDKTVLPSPQEQLGNDKGDIAWSSSIINPHHYRKAVVYAFRCADCGAVKTIKETNP